MKNFNIGDKVKLVSDSSVKGNIIDRFHSELSNHECLYIFLHDNDGEEEMVYEDEIELVEEVTYQHEFEYLDNLVIAKFFVIKGTSKTEIARGHGHIIHEGALGIAQASSYALKKVYENMGGTYKNDKN